MMVKDSTVKQPVLSHSMDKQLPKLKNTSKWCEGGGAVKVEMIEFWEGKGGEQLMYYNYDCSSHLILKQ